LPCVTIRFAGLSTRRASRPALNSSSTRFPERTTPSPACLPAIPFWPIARLCDFARSSCTVAISELADIVVADPYPSDLDFWQSLKGLNTACSALRPGGTVIFAAPCTEGVCSSHPEIAAIGFRHPAGHIENLVATGRLCPIPAAAIWLGARMLERAHVILVTKGVSTAEATAMGLEYASDPAAALAHALRRHGAGARINVLHKAAKMICSVAGKV